MYPIQSYSSSECDMILPILIGSSVIVTVALSIFFNQRQEEKKEEPLQAERVAPLIEPIGSMNNAEELPSPILANNTLIETKELLEDLIEKVLLRSAPEKEEEEGWVSVSHDIHA